MVPIYLNGSGSYVEQGTQVNHRIERLGVSPPELVLVI
jgi:hypothetical protein